MAANINKVAAKISALDQSLDELEAQLEPLFAQTLPETLVGLEKIQQAKLQVALPYLVYDLVFIYLKTRGIDPKTHPVVAELDRVRQYFEKIKNAENPATRTLVLDKGAAGRFIKHAIAQVKTGRPPGQDEGVSAQEKDVRVPVRITEKMIARAQYQKDLEALGSEEEEELEVIDDASDGSPQELPSSVDKGKGKALADDILADVAQAISGNKRRRPAVDAFDGYGDDADSPRKSSKASPERTDSAAEVSRASTPQSIGDQARVRQSTKKAKRKPKPKQQKEPSG
ncbi:hypothetical protein BDW22DRAFT_1384967 [Trametopsis cervina]|nr:hypothetical protein BDW22DRAFT_1384967 [Trametopsis cervina]